MALTNSVVAVFGSHQAAEEAVKQLTEAGFEMKILVLSAKDITPTRRWLASTTPVTVSNSGAPVAPFGVASGACSLVGYS